MNCCNIVMKTLKIKTFSGRFGPVISVHTDDTVYLLRLYHLKGVLVTCHFLFYHSHYANTPMQYTAIFHSCKKC